jgi:serine/threonine-protein kinase
MYMAPEQARGLAVDRRSDTYGLAAVLFEMVTGSPPFMDQTLASVYARLLTEVAPRASSLARDCPPALDRVLERALAKSPDDRFASVEELSLALAAVQTQSPPQATRSAG